MHGTRGTSRIVTLLPLLAISAVSASLVSCSVTPPGEINEFYRDVIDQRHQHYRLKEGDQLTIRLYSPQHSDLNQEAQLVLPDGKSDLFFMHDIQLTGKTVSEVEAEMRARVAKEVRDPEITIQVAPAEEEVHLYGDFTKPQTIPLTTRMTLGEAIAIAQGLRVTGDTDWALLRRPYMNPRHPDRFRIDLNDESEEIFLLPGDQVWLGKNTFGTIVHYIQTFFTSIIPNPAYFWYAFTP